MSIHLLRMGIAAARAAANASLIPDHTFSTGSVGAWVSSRDNTTLASPSGRLEATWGATTTDGMSHPLAMLAGTYEWSFRVGGGDGVGDRMYLVASITKRMESSNINFVNNYAWDQSGEMLSGTTVLAADKPWIAFIFTNVTSGSVVWVDDFVLRRIS